MKEKRKGCGFLIAALVATIIAAIIGFMAVKSGVDGYQSVNADSASGAVSFTTPSSGSFKALQDKEGTVWLSTIGETTSTKPTGYSVTVIDENGKAIASTNSSSETTVLNQVLLASFPCTKDSTYTVSITGLPDGSSIEVSHSATMEALGTVGKTAGGIFGAIILGFVAFILGIIGLVRWFTSKPKAPAQTA